MNGAATLRHRASSHSITGPLGRQVRGPGADDGKPRSHPWPCRDKLGEAPPAHGQGPLLLPERLNVPCLAIRPGLGYLCKAHYGGLGLQ